MQEIFHLKKGSPPVCELLSEDTSRLTYLPYCQHPCSSYASWTFQQESSPPPVLQISSFQLSLSFPTIFPGVELVKSVTSTNQLCQKEEEQCAYCSLTSAIFPVLHPMVKVQGWLQLVPEIFRGISFRLCPFQCAFCHCAPPREGACCFLELFSWRQKTGRLTVEFSK